MVWWQDAVGYEVYIRSFADSDGDGIGDLSGLTARLDYLAWLGIDVVWVTPFYPSPQADFGYDVADYLGIDPVYGDLDEFRRLVGRADQLGLRVMIDIVPNHTSSEHEWFRRALADPDDRHRRYYLFRPPTPEGNPPNNWVSHFGGPAWTLDPSSGEYYCHLFLPEQPDLDWGNEAVRAEFDAIFRFWMDLGIAGFRIDVAHALMKHESMADNPQVRPLPPNPSPGEAFNAFDHLHDHSQESSKEIFERWKRLPGADQVAFVGEVYIKDVTRSASYMAGDGLDQCLFFGLNRRPWDPRAFRAELAEWVEASPQGFAWTIASHDENRPPSRFGGGELGRRRALSLWTVLAMLPGMPFVYQGEELGLEDGYVAPEDVQDPVGLEALGEGRDPARTPMPWTSGLNNGFTTSSRPWLRSTPRTPSETVEGQRHQSDSHLHRFRALLAVRRELTEARRGPVEWLPAPADVIAFRRAEVVAIANLGDTGFEQQLPQGEWSMVYSTEPGSSPVIPAASARIYLC